MPRIDISAEDARLIKKYGGAIRRAAKAALLEEGVKGEPGLSVIITDDAGIQELNRRFRQIDKPTDVLSFPSGEQGKFAFLGDIAISAERAASQAREYGHSAERETAFLTAHSVLHLLGYDHIDESDERDMIERQKKIMAMLGYKD